MAGIVRKFLVTVCVVLVCILFYVAIMSTKYSRTSSDVSWFDPELRKTLQHIARHIHRAKLHSHGIKTRDSLNLAVTEMDFLLKKFGSSFLKATERNIKEKSESVCPEQYKDPDYGYPLFEDGYVEIECNYAKPLDSLVTVVMVYDRGWKHNISTVVQQVIKYNPKLSILLATSESISETFESKKYPHVKQSIMKSDASLGITFNDLVSKVKTPYTLIAPFVYFFHKDVRLHRLIREIELLDLDVAGGAIRNSSGHWYMGCYQRAELNYTLTYREGYDESFNDCVFCDHIEGPFIAKTDVLKKLKFSKNLPINGLFEDFFLRVSGEMAVCPDSMFYIHKEPRRKDSKAWHDFARSRNLIKLSWAENFDIEFDCSYKYPCSAKAGCVIHPCCIKDLSSLTNKILKVCESEGMFCEPHGGSILGPIKFGNTLPWERDTDIRVLVDNFTQIINKKDLFIEKGLKISYTKQNTRQCPKIPGGSMNINSKHWKADVYPYCNVSSVEALKSGLSVTKMQHLDTLISVPRNPGLAVRNRYPGLYKHSEHCSVLGINALGLYKDHVFRHCSQKHLSLSRYNSDGNLQFLYGVLP